MLRQQHKPSQPPAEKFESVAHHDGRKDKKQPLMTDTRRRTVVMWISFLVGFGIGVTAFSFTWYSTFLLVQHAKSRSSTAWTLSDPKVLVVALAIISISVFYAVLLVQTRCVKLLGKRVKTSEMPKGSSISSSGFPPQVFSLSETLKVGTLAGILTVWGGAVGSESEGWEAVIAVLWLCTICVWYMDSGSETTLECDMPSTDDIAIV